MQGIIAMRGSPGSGGGFIFDGVDMSMPPSKAAGGRRKKAAAASSSVGDNMDSKWQNQVDDFLSAPGPSIGGASAGKAGGGSSLPKLNAQQLRKDRTALRLDTKPKAKKSSGYGQRKAAPAKPLDAALLAEAMAYADSLKAAEVTSIGEEA